MLPTLDSVLSDTSAKDKVIFLHLMGSHFPYEERLPEDFPRQFNSPKTPSKFDLDEEQSLNYNTYDNTIVYNDYVVSQIFDRSFALSGNRAVVYLSDHGEEVYDEFLFAGRSNNYISHNLYDIPFLMYVSKEFGKEFDIKPSSLEKPYHSQLFGFTVLRLCGITTEYDWSQYSIIQ